MRFVLFFAALTLSAQVFPPWTKGENNPALNKGYEFQVPDIDNVPDLHGNPNGALLVLFVGGNQFMVMPALIHAFEVQHPELRGRIFYETLPPGILTKQIAANGIITLGNFTLQVQADIYEAALNAVQEIGTPVSYATNDLAIMVRKGNPLNIASLADLGKDNVRLSMPNPAWEGVAKQIAASMEKTGGAALVEKVMKQKVADNSTFLTQIHHRQTPIRILSGQSDAGVTWGSEVIFQEQIGNPITGVKIPAAQNSTATYAAAMVKNAPHREAAAAWLAFLTTEPAQKAYAAYGFKPVTK